MYDGVWCAAEVPEDKAANIALAVIAAKARGALIDACAAYRENNSQVCAHACAQCLPVILLTHSWLVEFLRRNLGAPHSAGVWVPGGALPAAEDSWSARGAAAAAAQPSGGYGCCQHLPARYAAGAGGNVHAPL